jgi:CRISPR-associated protein Csm1
LPARLSAPPERDLAYSQVLDGLGLRTEPRQPPHGAAEQTLYLADPDPPDTPDVLSGMRYTVAEAQRATQHDVDEYRRLGLAEADDQPLNEDNVWPFSFLAQRSTGVKRLSVLRMDVDNLGDLFRELDRAPGIGALAHTAALSAALSRFFEGWVEVICREFNRRDGDGNDDGGIYAVYSGGDDLFLVGSWHLMPHLARRIRDDFARYVQGGPLNGAVPPITLSAGITLHTASYPLYQAADEAAEALDAAKRFTRPDDRGKDAISFLGQRMGWEQFAEVKALQTELEALIAKGAPRGLLMAIQNLAAQATAGDRRTRSGAPQLSYGPWIWQGAYQLTRLAERAPTELKTPIADLRERLVGPTAITQRTIERAGLAARWTQLLIRNTREDVEDDQEVSA